MIEVIAGLVGAVVVMAAVIVVIQSAAFVFFDTALLLWNVLND